MSWMSLPCPTLVVLFYAVYERWRWTLFQSGVHWLPSRHLKTKAELKQEAAKGGRHADTSDLASAIGLLVPRSPSSGENWHTRITTVGTAGITLLKGLQKWLTSWTKQIIDPFYKVNVSLWYLISSPYGLIGPIVGFSDWHRTVLCTVHCLKKPICRQYMDRSNSPNDH